MSLYFKKKLETVDIFIQQDVNSEQPETLIGIIMLYGLISENSKYKSKNIMYDSNYRFNKMESLYRHFNEYRYYINNHTLNQLEDMKLNERKLKITRMIKNTNDFYAELIELKKRFFTIEPIFHYTENRPSFNRLLKFYKNKFS